MQEDLQNSFKTILSVAITALVLFIGCNTCSAAPEPSEINGIKASSTAKTETAEVMEMNTMNKFTPDSKITTELSTLLGCNEKTAETVQKNIVRAIGYNISGVTAETDEIGTKLTVTDENGDLYTVFMGKGYFVQEIYRDSENGKRIFAAIE